jgi:hypothetical protein
MYHFDTCNSILFKHRIHDPHPKNIQLKSAKMSAATSSFEAAAGLYLLLRQCGDEFCLETLHIEPKPTRSSYDEAILLPQPCCASWWLTKLSS